MLSRTEQEYRELAFREAHRYVDRAARAGGMPAGSKKSFPIRPRADHRRVDVEVSGGVAFVPDTASQS